MRRIEEDLLEAAASIARSASGEMPEAYWRIITDLHRSPSPYVFEACRLWSASSDAWSRRISADVLGQLGYEDGRFPFREETIPILQRLLADPHDSVVSAALVALGHLGSEESAEKIIALSRHENPEVRHAVPFSLLGSEASIAIDAMIDLSRDEAAEVRDWATFGLGSEIQADTAPIRDALLARATDSDEETRAEALAGLVRLRDPRVVQLLIQALESAVVGTLEVQAAHDLGLRELVVPLVRLRSWWDVDRDLLEAAILRCERNQPLETG